MSAMKAILISVILALGATAAGYFAIDLLLGSPKGWTYLSEH